MSETPPGKRTVTLPTADYLVFQQIAEDDGQSLSAWILDAARHKRARREAEKFARAVASPELAAELAEMQAGMNLHRAARLAMIEQAEIA